MMKKLEKSKKKHLSFSKILLGIIVTYLVVTLTIVAVQYNAVEKERKQNMADVQTKSIASCDLLSNNKSEQFVIGVSNVGTIYPVEYYLYVQKGDGHTLKNIKAECIEIVIADDVEPYIEGHFNSYGDIYTYWDVCSTLDKDYIYEMTHYTIYVPSDYVTEEYKAK